MIGNYVPKINLLTKYSKLNFLKQGDHEVTYF